MSETIQKIFRFRGAKRAIARERERGKSSEAYITENKPYYNNFRNKNNKRPARV